MRRVAAQPVPVFRHRRLVALVDRRLFRLGPWKDHQMFYRATVGLPRVAAPRLA